MSKTQAQPIACIALLLSALTTTSAQAATRTWPGASPCNGTLQACFNASASGDTVLLATDSAIDESLNIGRAVNLIAAEGFSPRFAAGRSLFFLLSEPDLWSLRVSGITIDDGELFAQVLDDGSVVFEDIVATRSQGVAPIRVTLQTSLSGAYAASVDIRNCTARLGANTNFGITLSAAEGAAMTARIADNRIEPVGVPAPRPANTLGPSGIVVDAVSSLASSIDIVRNQVRTASASTDPAARLANGIALYVADAGASVAARVADNVMVLRPGSSFRNAGVSLLFEGGNTDARVLGNTVIGGQTGMRVQRFGSVAALGGRIDNNLFAYADSGVVFEPPEFESGVGNDHNAVFGVAANEFTPGPNTFTLDPGIVSMTRPRLHAISPLRGNGSIPRRSAAGPGTMSPLPALDADGLRRVKQARIDVGAFEFGDDSLRHNATVTANSSTINDEVLNVMNAHLLQFTRSGGRSAAASSPSLRPLSQRYLTSTLRWEVVADDGQNFDVGAGFHVFVPSVGDGRAMHVATAGNTTGALTALDPPLASLPSDTVFLVTPTRDVGGAGVANPHPVASTFQFDRWYLINLNSAPIPAGARFTIYAQAPSANAFVHISGPGNQPNSIVTEIDHPVLNGNHCAAPHVSASANGGINANPISVRYDPTRARWFIRNENGAVMSAGIAFNVVVDAEAAEADCSAIFGDGFGVAIPPPQ
ncbi:MAG: DUF7452 domain-containing protein [Pseudomarimonas sp.]